jgi:hypothetical protein
MSLELLQLLSILFQGSLSMPSTVSIKILSVEVTRLVTSEETAQPAAKATTGLTTGLALGTCTD